jgi:hypothetical protein
MLGDTQLIDYSRESGSNAKSSDCFLEVGQKSQWSRKTPDHTKAKKAGHAHYLLEMKGSFESKDVDVLGIEMDDETSKQVVIDVLARDVNAPKVRAKVLPQHT